MGDSATATHRWLRAFLRPVVSPGMWLLLGVQLAYPVLKLGGLLPADDDSPRWVYEMLRGITTAAAFFFTAGMFASLAQLPDAVAARDVIQGAKEKFGEFIGLMLKALLVVIVLLFVVVTLFAPSTDDPVELGRQIGVPIVIGILVLRAILVWWLPVVFVTNDFRLFPTIARAGQLLLSSPTRSLLPVLLSLSPLMVLMVAAERVVWLTLAVDIVATLLAWMANTYCIEWIKDSRAGSAADPASGPRPE